MKLIYATITVILILGAVGGCSNSHSGKKAPAVTDGAIDLSEWDFKLDGQVRLDGEWEFYPGVLLSPESLADAADKRNKAHLPQTWNNLTIDGKKIPAHGCATYRCTIKHKSAGRLLAIKTYDMATAFKLYADGKPVFSNGTVGDSPDKSSPQYLPGIAIFTPASNETEIVLQISNYHHRLGGPWYSMEIGEEKLIRHIHQNNILLELFLFGILLIMGLYHLGLYALRRSDVSPLLFGLFCLIIGMRTILIGERFFITIFPGFNWEAANKIEYITFFLSAPVFSHFIQSLYPHEFSKKIILYPLYGLSAAFCITVLASPAVVYSYIMMWYQLITLIAVVNATGVLVLASIRKRGGAFIFLIGAVMFFATVINDVLYTNQVIQTGNFVSMGLFIFIFSQAFILSIRFSRALTTVEILSGQLQKINLAYSKFVPIEFLNFLKKESIIDVELGDQVQREMTVLFSDIREFSTLSEQMTPKENFNFLNSLLKQIGPVIRDQHGFIDKYIGDAIMALFPTDPTDALNAALNMRSKLITYNGFRKNTGYVPIEIGTGIHTGMLMLGTIGESERMEGTVIADAVNLSSRLEGLTKYFKAQIIISSSTLEKLTNADDYNYRFLGRVRVKGKTDSIGLYEVFDGEPEEIRQLKLSSKKDFESAIQHYMDKDFDSAERLFRKILDADVRDGGAEFYLEQIEYYQNHVTPVDWDGVIVMTDK